MISYVSSFIEAAEVKCLKHDSNARLIKASNQTTNKSWVLLNLGKFLFIEWNIWSIEKYQLLKLTKNTWHKTKIDSLFNYSNQTYEM